MRRRTATVNGDDEVSARSAGDRVKHFLRSLGIGAGMEDAQLTADRLRVLRDALPWAMAARLVAGIALLLLGDGGLAPVLFAPLALMLAADAAYLFLGSAKRLSAPNPVRAMRLVRLLHSAAARSFPVMFSQGLRSPHRPVSRSELHCFVHRQKRSCHKYHGLYARYRYHTTN